MTTKQVFFTLSCLLFLVIAGQSNIVRAQESLQVQQDRERHKNNLRSHWNGGGASIGTEALLRDSGFRAALGVSDEHYQKILANVRNAVENRPLPPECLEVGREHGDALEALTGSRTALLIGESLNINMQGTDEEKIKAYNRLREAERKMQSLQMEIALENDRRYDAAFEEAITPELNQKIQEAWLAAMGETSTFSPRLFEALNLTDAQREGMERIKKELELELEKHTEIYGSNAAKILERFNAALERHQRHASEFSFGRRGDAPEEWRTVYKKLRDEPEHRKLLDESYASGKALATLFRTRMSEILNDDQRSRLQDLTENPPPYARLLIQRLRRENWGRDEEVESNQSGKSERAGGDKDIWVPGPDSWKPGDPIPEGSRRERNESGNFPRETN